MEIKNTCAACHQEMKLSITSTKTECPHCHKSMQVIPKIGKIATILFFILLVVTYSFIVGFFPDLGFQFSLLLEVIIMAGITELFYLFYLKTGRYELRATVAVSRTLVNLNGVFIIMTLALIILPALVPSVNATFRNLMSIVCYLCIIYYDMYFAKKEMHQPFTLLTLVSVVLVVAFTLEVFKIV